jgi:hypothetical protein
MILTFLRARTSSSPALRRGRARRRAERVRILVLFAHPVETSFASSLHAKLVEVLRAKGHKVDDCDLYAEGFDPVTSRQDRIDYHNLAVNRRS